MKEKTVELVVGVFVMVGLALLGYMIVRFGNLNYAEKNYKLSAIFSYTNGVVIGAPVRCAGVEVGKVEELKFAEDKKFGVEVVMSIKDGTVIRRDVVVVVNSLGIMGEKYIEFLPQSITAPVLAAGDKVEGQDPVAISQLMVEGRNIASKIDNMISGWSDKKTQENVKDAIRNIKLLTDEDTQKSFKASLNNISDITGSPNKENLAQAIKTIKESSENANNVFRKLDEVLTSNRESFNVIGKKTVDLLDSLKRVVDNVEKGEGTVGTLIKDKEIGQDIKDFIKDIKANPWKLFIKTDEKRPSSGKKDQQGKVFGIF